MPVDCPRGGRVTCLRVRPSPRGLRRAAAGFTLFEVLVALAIVAIAGVAAVQTFGIAARLADRSRVELALSLSAREVLEETRLQPPAPGTSQGELHQGPYLVRWTRTVATTDAPPLQHVEVTVEAVDSASPPLHLETYLSGL
jgi:general secretion pathway protein I